MLATVHSGALRGIEAVGVCIEAEFTQGLPGFDIIGLAETAVRESRFRVKAALEAHGYQLPRRRLLLNLAPADLKKSGASFDLGIAVAIVAACGLCHRGHFEETLFVGEISLSGEIRRVPGVLAQIRSASQRGLKTIVVPQANSAEAAMLFRNPSEAGIDVRVASHLIEVLNHLNDNTPLKQPGDVESTSPANSNCDLAEVRGQPVARRALEVAAVGGHPMLLVGPPGSGKSMLAQRLPTVLVPPDPQQALEIATIASIMNRDPVFTEGRVCRPFRAPHHSASLVAMVGGGSPVQPGEVTLAHQGVLFLDEFPEFRRDAVESLRVVLETGHVHIARARERICFPARPLVVAAMNPCPCGFASTPDRLCLCGPEVARRYQSRLSKPLLDRFDLQVSLPPVKSAWIHEPQPSESSREVLLRVRSAQEILRARPVLSLAELLEGTERGAICLLDRAMDALGISARTYVKILRVSRTIAAMEGLESVERRHVAEAIQFRIQTGQQEEPRLQIKER